MNETKRHSMFILLYVFLLVTFPFSSAWSGQAFDATTLHNKLIVGYQGWFSARNDGSPLENGFWHWSDGFEMYPNLSEYSNNGLYDYLDGFELYGDKAKVFSSYDHNNIMLHFQWMKEYNIDGAFLQRYANELTNADKKDFRDDITGFVKESAESTDRVFAIMYDLTGCTNRCKDGSLIVEDWEYLYNKGYANSPNYLYHEGRPLLILYGFGFANEGRYPQQQAAKNIINKLRESDLDPTIFITVPGMWRTSKGVAGAIENWEEIYQSVDGLMAWPVGRSYIWNNPFEHYKADLEKCAEYEIEYMPIIFPGTSFSNTKQDKKFNLYPRMGGTNYWSLGQGAVEAGAQMIYVAMFDEVDEATSIFKVASNEGAAPMITSDDFSYWQWLNLDEDGYTLPTDWYLTLSSDIRDMLINKEPVNFESLYSLYGYKDGTPAFFFLDGDGRIFSFATMNSNNSIAGVIKIGNPHLDWSWSLTSQQTWDKPIGVGDIDGNGIDEIMLINGEGTIRAILIESDIIKNAIVLGNPRSKWGWALSSQTTWDKPMGVGDIDGDGKDELIIINGSGTIRAVVIENKKITKSIVLGNPRSKWGWALSSQTTWDKPIGVGDIDGDGKDELIIINGSGTIRAVVIENKKIAKSIVLGNPHARWDWALTSQQAWDKPIGMSDIDGDSTDEIFLYNGDGEIKAIKYDTEGLSSIELNCPRTDWGWSLFKTGDSWMRPWNATSMFWNW